MILFSDLNQELCKKIEDLGLVIKVFNQDVFKTKSEYPLAKIITASNPQFSAGGGLDLALKIAYPIEWVQAKEGLITTNLCFVISVDKKFRATKELIRLALGRVLVYSKRFDVILTGLGTGIGGLSFDVFVGLVKELLGAGE